MGGAYYMKESQQKLETLMARQSRYAERNDACVSAAEHQSGTVEIFVAE
jgi:hypothetical protein